jgi:cell wall-associated NlpC family hydrolase
MKSNSTFLIALILINFIFLMTSCSTGFQRMGYDRNIGAYPQASYTIKSKKITSSDNSKKVSQNFPKKPNSKKTASQKPSQKKTSTSKQIPKDKIDNLGFPEFASTTDSSSTVNNSETEGEDVAEKTDASNSSNDVNSLKKIIQPWLGVPYLWGGNDKNGVDCSGYAKQILQDYFGVEIPRTTSEGFETGQYVSKSDLITGDLVYFGNFWGVEHVGVYVENQEFSHSSTSAGVRYDKLDSPYWESRYKGARRYQ